MGLFTDIKTYATGWSLKATNKISPADISAVDRAVVVDSKFGASVCFFEIRWSSVLSSCSR